MGIVSFSLFKITFIRNFNVNNIIIIIIFYMVSCRLFWCAYISKLYSFLSVNLKIISFKPNGKLFRFSKHQNLSIPYYFGVTVPLLPKLEWKLAVNQLQWTGRWYKNIIGIMFFLYQLLAFNLFAYLFHYSVYFMWNWSHAYKSCNRSSFILIVFQTVRSEFHERFITHSPFTVKRVLSVPR